MSLKGNLLGRFLLSKSVKHTPEGCGFEDFLGVMLLNENLVTLVSNWDTVLSGMKVASENKFLDLFHRLVMKC